jgi:hypothetical protein
MSVLLLVFIAHSFVAVVVNVVVNVVFVVAISYCFVAINVAFDCSFLKARCIFTAVKNVIVI